MIPVDGYITEADIADALNVLKYERLTGDRLRVALAEDSLNDLIDRYSQGVTHGGFTARPTGRGTQPRAGRRTKPS